MKMDRIRGHKIKRDMRGNPTCTLYTAFYLPFVVIDENGRGKKLARKLNRQTETEIVASNLLK